MKKFFVMLYLLILFCEGCSLYHINSVQTASGNAENQKAAQDIVYLETVAQPYEVIGAITVNAERNQNMENILMQMKAQAAQLGGDAIINLKSDATGAWQKVPFKKLTQDAYIRANFTAEVVILK